MRKKLIFILEKIVKKLSCTHHYRITSRTERIDYIENIKMIYESFECSKCKDRYISNWEQKKI